MEAYDFIKLYQGDFPKCKCFWLHPVLPFCFSIIASKITNVHKLLPLKNFFRVEGEGGGRGVLKVKVKPVKSLIYHVNHLNYFAKESMNIPKWSKRHKLL